MFLQKYIEVVKQEGYQNTLCKGGIIAYISRLSGLGMTTSAVLKKDDVG